MYGPASYLGCIWSFSFQANCHLRVKFELRFLDNQKSLVVTVQRSFASQIRVGFSGRDWRTSSFVFGEYTDGPVR